jgi:DNA-binding MarR family transcriptional regulator
MQEIAEPAKAGEREALPARGLCTSFQLRRVSRLVGRRYDAHLAAVGLKTTQYSLLSALERVGAMRSIDLARLLALDASTLTRNLEPLVEAGWVESAPGADRRTRLLRLTRKGAAQRQRARVHWQAAQRELAGLLGPSTLSALHAVLGHCHDRLRSVDSPEGANDSSSRS